MTAWVEGTSKGYEKFTFVVRLEKIVRLEK